MTESTTATVTGLHGCCLEVVNTGCSVDRVWESGKTALRTTAALNSQESCCMRSFETGQGLWSSCPVDGVDDTIRAFERCKGIATGCRVVHVAVPNKWMVVDASLRWRAWLRDWSSGLDWGYRGYGVTRIKNGHYAWYLR